MFMTFFFLGWSLLHLYVFWRLTSIPAVNRHLSGKALAAVAGVIWATLFLRIFLDSQGWESTARLIELFDMNWLGTLFLVFCALLVIDIVTVFGIAFRSHVHSLRVVGLLAGIALAGTAFVQGMRAPVVRDYEVRVDSLPKEFDGLRIAAISDLHVGRLLDGDWLAARVGQLNALQPDVILLLGDLLEGDSPAERKDSTLQTLKNLNARYGVWGVTGNHESHGGQGSSVRFLQAAGIHILQNEWQEIQPGLVVGGVDDGGHRESPAASSERTEQLLAAKPSDVATIFLSHRPLMAEAAAAAKVDFMLSGHTHGGQIWPFSYIVALLNPLLAGRYDISGMPVIVSRGAGTWGPRMRLWAPGEILQITLRPK